MNATIYVIRCHGRCYVGQTRLALRDRWRAHVNAARQRRSGCAILNAAIRKYGPDRFEIETLEWLKDVDQATVDAREESWISALGSVAPNGYNLRTGGHRGAIHPDTKAKMSATHSGRKRPDSWKANISAALTGRKHPPERIENMRAGRARAGWAVSEATRKKLSKAGKGRQQHPNQVAALHRAHVGSKRTPEQRANISAGIRAAHARMKAVA